MNNRPTLLMASVAVWMMSVAAAGGSAVAANTVTEMFTTGAGAVSFRYRLEHVDQDSFSRDALASTVRARLNFTTGEWNGFGGFIEFDYVTDVLADDYNAGAGNTPDKVMYPVIADPTGPDLNQAFLQWRSAEGSLLRGGRQRIIYDNARFVGNVGWRQNEQTYDAGFLQHQTGGGLDIQLAYVWQVNRIFGDDVPAGTNDSSTWLLNLSQSWDAVGKLTGYVYAIDDEDVWAFSTRTYGARFAGARPLGRVSLGYALEYARQTDAHRNPVDYDANYYRADLSLTVSGITPYAGFESLGGDTRRGGAAFRTPLATLHAFNGWADMFLTTPDAGLDDLFAGVRGNMGAWKWDMLYHVFETESGGAGLGKEFDASISRSFAERYGILFKAAWFDGDSGSGYPDTAKLWAQLTADF